MGAREGPFSTERRKIFSAGRRRLLRFFTVAQKRSASAIAVHRVGTGSEES